MAQPTLAPVVATPDLGRVRRTWAALPTVLRYGVVGGVTQVVYLSVLGGALVLGAHYLLALLTAQLVAIAFAFPAYRGLVFEATGPLGRQLVTFLGVWWSGAVTSIVGVPVCVEAFGLRPFVAQLVVLVLVVGLSFLGHLRVTFRQRPAA